MQPKIVQFGEQDYLIKKEISNCYEAQEDYEEAAKILEKINFESTSKEFEISQKVEVYVCIAEYWATAEDSINAERYANKAAHLIHKVQDPELQLRYKCIQASINDQKRKFVIASQAYYDLSNNEANQDPAIQ